MKQKLTGLLDYFYPPFRRFIPLETFRYAACGGANALMGFIVYVISFRYIFEKEVFHFGISAFEPHIAALVFSSMLVFIFGFLLNKYVVFVGSKLRGRIQLFRYFISFSFNFVINYFLLKFFVEMLLWDAVPSQIVTICIVVGISYITQKHFSFRSAK